MAIEFFESFDTGISKPEWTTPVGPYMPGYGARTGIACGSVSNTLALPASTSKTVGCAYYDGSGGGTSDHFIIAFYGASGKHISLSRDSSQRLTVYRGGPPNEGGTLIATSPIAYPTGQWRHIEMKVTVDDAVGTVQVKQDGVLVIDFTGDTRNGQADALLRNVGFNHAGNTLRAWDDLFVLNATDDTANTGRPDNAWLGDLKVECLLPNGNGASSQWVGSDGNSVDNYLLVDESGNPNTSDYVATSVSGNKDFFAMQDPSASVASVYAVRAGIYAAKSDAGASLVKIALRESSGTQTNEANSGLSTSWSGYSGLTRPSKPGGGAWGITDVQGLQVGVELA